MSDDAPFSAQPDPHEAAAAWWVKIDAGSLSRSDCSAFKTWLAQNPAHQAAFDEVSLLCADVRAQRPSPSAVITSVTARRRRLALLSGIAGACAVLVLLYDDLSLRWRADYWTGTGETQMVALEDGTRAELGPRSAIAVDYHHGAQRKVALLEGEAWFEAAPNPSRPFAVAAAGGTVTALGTAFDIALTNQGAVVTVTQHRVAVASQGQIKVVGEGQQSTFGANMPMAAPASVNTGDVTAWRRGKLIFVNRPLGEVIAILSRYHHGYVLIPSAAVRELRVTGVFDAGDPLGMLRSMESSLAIRAAFFTNYLVILYV